MYDFPTSSQPRSRGWETAQLVYHMITTSFFTVTTFVKQCYYNVTTLFSNVISAILCNDYSTSTYGSLFFYSNPPGEGNATAEFPSPSPEETALPPSFVNLERTVATFLYLNSTITRSQPNLHEGQVCCLVDILLLSVLSALKHVAISMPNAIFPRVPWPTGWFLWSFYYGTHRCLKAGVVCTHLTLCPLFALFLPAHTCPHPGVPTRA